MFTKKRIKKIFLAALAFLEIFLLNISPVLAIHIPSANEMAGDLEQRYHINDETLQNQGEQLNVSSYKAMAPQITMTFDPLNPKIGDRITAKAVPMYFNSTKESMYYTWYLKHPKCDLSEEAPPPTTPEPSCYFSGSASFNGTHRLAFEANGGSIQVINYSESGTRYVIGTINLPAGVTASGSTPRFWFYGWDRNCSKSESTVHITSSGNTVTFSQDVMNCDPNVPAQSGTITFSGATVSGSVDFVSGYSDDVGVPMTRTITTSGKTVTFKSYENSTPSFKTITGSLTFSYTSACDSSGSGSGSSTDNSDGCDLDGDKKITVEDWKIAAARILASNGFDYKNADYGSQPDDKDGYQAFFGGNDREKMPDHCYVHDFGNGKNYELVDEDTINSNSVHCADPVNYTAICVKNQSLDCLESNSTANLETASSSGGGTTTTYDSTSNTTLTTYNTCASAGTPSCAFSSDSTSAKPQCSEGTPVCVEKSYLNNGEIFNVDLNDTTNTCNEVKNYGSQSCSAGSAHFAAASCSGGTDNFGDGCRHLFPNYTDSTGNIINKTGNNSFDVDEEKFWQTNPRESSTAGNGNKDEANIAGLGRDTFTWNYQPGDKIGVAIEGVAAMISTKYKDSSAPVMWALSKNACSIEKYGADTGETTRYISGYNVTIPYVHLNLNKCLPDNLIDPREEKGYTGLNPTLSYAPDNPVDDPTCNAQGVTDQVCTANNQCSSGTCDTKLGKCSCLNRADELMISSSIENTQDKQYLKYEWSVDAACIDTPDLNNNADWTTVHLDDLAPDVQQLSGLGLDTLRFRLNLNNNDIGCAANNNAPTFLRVKLKVSENVADQNMDSTKDTIINSGNAQIVIPLTSATNQLYIYPARVETYPQISLNTLEERCVAGTLDGAACPVVKNEILGIVAKTDSAGGPDFDNYSWSLDGEPLTYPAGMYCDYAGLGACDPKKSTAYFPIFKQPGDEFSVTVVATNAIGDKVTLSRNFKVVEPSISIRSAFQQWQIDQAAANNPLAYQTPCILKSTDPSRKDVCPVVTGSYADPTNATAAVWPDFSDTEFQTLAGNNIGLTLKRNNPWIKDYSWSVNNTPVTSALPTMTSDPEGLFSTAYSTDKAPADILSLNLDTTNQPNTLYSVYASGHYYQDDNTKKLLHDNYGIQLNEFYEKDLSSNINITVVDPTSLGLVPKEKVLATLFSGLPTYLYFLFKIALTTALLIFVSWISMAFVSPNNYDEN